MASLTRKKDCKNWIACFTLPDGTRTNRTTRTSNKKAARKVAAQYEEASVLAKRGQLNEARARKVVSDILESAGVPPLETTTVKSFLLEWAGGKEGGTKERYSTVVDRFLKSLGGKAHSLISNISYRDIGKFIQSRKKQGLAPKTISVDVKALNTAFNLAKKLGLTQQNPVDKALALKPLKSTSSVKEVFTPAQVSTLIQAASDEWKTMIILGYFTGARLEDCANMQWSHINFAEQVVDFVASKSGVRTVVPMTSQLEAHINSLINDGPELYLCPSLHGKSSGGNTGLSRSFKTIMGQAGIDPKEGIGMGKRKFSKLSFHSLRHSFNSLLANQGVDQETRMKLVGQKSAAINTEYTHIDLPKLTSAMSKLPKLKIN